MIGTPTDLSDYLSGHGPYCCPICLTYYETREEKQMCMTERHGYEVLEITPR
jgi:hypothetical protein